MKNGARTLPIALYLARQSETEAAQLLDLLAEARQDEAARTAVRQRLREAGTLQRVGFIVEMYRERAELALAQVQPSEPARARLHIFLDQLLPSRHRLAVGTCTIRPDR